MCSTKRFTSAVLGEGAQYEQRARSTRNVASAVRGEGVQYRKTVCSTRRVTTSPRIAHGLYGVMKQFKLSSKEMLARKTCVVKAPAFHYWNNGV